MHNDWIVDVLADLRSFARQNGMASLAEQIDDTIMVAAAEISRTRQSKASTRTPDEGEARGDHHGIAAGDNL